MPKQTTKGKVFLMMSGGVDSSVAASILIESGYQVVGVFVKCWSVESLKSLNLSQQLYQCFWEEDSQDARLVAGQLNIPFYVWDFQEEYKARVVDYMLTEYQHGRTPNPDVMCNAFIKFGIFYKKAIRLGADFVATGHYAKAFNPNQELFRGQDLNKDQSYFLWAIKKSQLSKILFPIGNFESKDKLRKLAEKIKLPTAKKPDSQGICFVGKTPLRQILLAFLGLKRGKIVAKPKNLEFSPAFQKPQNLEQLRLKNQDYVVLGQHDGAYLYTPGQREKLGLAGGPWFVKEVFVDQNLVEVVHQRFEKEIFSTQLVATNTNWLVEIEYGKPIQATAQVRYRQKEAPCTIEVQKNLVKACFLNPVKAVSKGQSVVFYQNGKVLGGGIIAKNS